MRAFFGLALTFLMPLASFAVPQVPAAGTYRFKDVQASGIVHTEVLYLANEPDSRRLGELRAMNAHCKQPYNNRFAPMTCWYTEQVTQSSVPTDVIMALTQRFQNSELVFAKEAGSPQIVEETSKAETWFVPQAAVVDGEAYEGYIYQHPYELAPNGKPLPDKITFTRGSSAKGGRQFTVAPDRSLQGQLGHRVPDSHTTSTEYIMTPRWTPDSI